MWFKLSRTLSCALRYSDPCALRFASEDTATTSSAGSTGLTRCIWNPLCSTFIRSSARAYAVSAAAGTSRTAGSSGIGLHPSRRL